MKTLKRSNSWKTDPRAAYIPGAVLASIVLVVCLAALPAWSFETIESDQALDGVNSALTTSHPSSPTVVDPCLPLLKSIRHTPPQSIMDRNQRSAGKAAALGLVLGVRFALAPPQKTGSSRAAKPHLDIWQPAGASNDRSALAVTAYRQCQKEQALKALSKFRWTR